LKVNGFKIVIMTTAKLAMHLHLLQLLFVPYDYFHILMILLLMGFTENEKNYNHPPMKTTFTQCINSYWPTNTTTYGNVQLLVRLPRRLLTKNR